MTIILYNNSDEPNKLNKNITKIDEQEFKFLNSNNILMPSILLQRNLIDFNYVYIEELNRYYFVKDFISNNNSLWTINLLVDCLHTYANEIINCNVHVVRSSTLFNNNLKDEYNSVENKFNSEVLIKNKLIGIDRNMEYYIPSSCIYVVSIVGRYGMRDLSKGEKGVFSPPCSLLASTNPIIERFALTAVELETLIKAIIDNSELASYIVSIFCYPISNLIDFVGADYFSISDMTLGPPLKPENTVLHDVHKFTGRANGFYHNTKNPINIKISRKYNNYLDFSPYMNYKIYLPYVGNIELPNEVVYGYEDYNLYIDYGINFSNGEIVYCIYCKNNNNEFIVTSPSGIIGFQIPINANNQQEIDRRFQQNETIGITSGVISAIMIISGIALTATGYGSGAGVGLITGGITTGVGALGKGLSQIQSIPDATNGGSGVLSNSQHYYDDNFRLIRTELSHSVEPDVLKNSIGLPSNYYGKLLNQESGSRHYCDLIHLEGFTCTLDELNIIEQKVKEGIII